MNTQNWYRGEYLLSTDPKLLQVDAINAALGSDMIWWASDLPAVALLKALKNSLCFGLYEIDSSQESNGTISLERARSIKQIGLLRVITDNVTFAYLTDFYILDSYQGSGLARWMLDIFNERLRQWPYLRRAMLLTTDKMHLFNKLLGMKNYSEFDGMNGVSIAMVEGPGAQH